MIGSSLWYDFLKNIIKILISLTKVNIAMTTQPVSYLCTNKWRQARFTRFGLSLFVCWWKRRTLQILRLTSDRLSKVGTFCGFGYYAFTASNTAGNPGTFLSSEIFLHFSLAVEHAVKQFNRASELAFLISDRRYCDQLFLM